MEGLPNLPPAQPLDLAAHPVDCVCSVEVGEKPRDNVMLSSSTTISASEKAKPGV